MMKIEKATIKIKGKNYTFLKPRAVDMIELEDKAIGTNGEMDFEIYSSEMIKLVAPGLTVDGLVDFVPQEIVLSSGDKIVLPEIGFTKWKAEMTKIGKFSRASLAKNALAISGVSGTISLDDFKYADIDALATGFFKLYDSTELNAVIEEISNSCFS
ncbi:MAG: hypothetical protein ACRC6E_07625 [Fusobacteriaceae bacterium]